LEKYKKTLKTRGIYNLYRNYVERSELSIRFFCCIMKAILEYALKRDKYKVTTFSLPCEEAASAIIRPTKRTAEVMLSYFMTVLFR